MADISTIGLDIAKRVFQVHGIDDQGKIVAQKQLSRSQVLAWFGRQAPCLVGIEACATSTYWAREIRKLGHEVRLIPPAYVKPYVRRQKNDRTDAAAICEAVSRPSMRFVAIKTVEQQSIQVLHRARELLITQRTQAINALRAHLAEFGLIFPQGLAGVTAAMKMVQDGDEGLPEFVQQVLASLADHIGQIRQQVALLDKQIVAWHRASADSQRLATIPGIGVMTATALLAAMGDGRQFRSGREFAAWLGLVPNQNSSGGNERLGRISKRGNTQLRSLLVLGATAMLQGKRDRLKTAGGTWFNDLLKRKPARLATVALANKMARIAWAVLTKGGVYRARPANDDMSAILQTAVA
jgi:transposase